MKKSTLILGVLLAGTAWFTPAQAQVERDTHKTDVIVIGGGALADDNQVVFHFKKSAETGFQAAKMPRFVISTKDQKYMFGIGGFVNFRTAYDFDGVVQNTDFVTYNIPVVGTPATRQQLRMDASTSRLFFKSIANTSSLGPIVTYIETDFRGGNYNLRLRKAYIALGGFLFGQNTTTFCDLNAAPTTVDFQGPNAYNYNFALMLRYTYNFNQHWSIGAALELPELSATYTPETMEVPQRLPDFPIFVKYAWGENSRNYIRGAGVLRDMIYYDKIKDKNHSVLGWGVQASTNLYLSPKLMALGQFVYGEGISPYIQDITGDGLDLVANPDVNGELKTLPMFGWFAGLQYNFTSNLFCSATYSMVRVQGKDQYGPANPDGYRNAQYMVGNVFYNLTPSCQIGVEYLRGIRKNFDLAHNSANRIQAMIQYNF